MSKLKSILHWLDKNLLFALSAFLIIFIPLFPKVPLFEVLPGYIVKARAEDVFIFITAIVWLKDAYKKRFAVKTTYLWIVGAYTVVGIFSILLGTFLIQSIPNQLLHVGKSALHLFRYLEYFALFFFAYSSVKSKKEVTTILALISASVLFVVLYGFGQAYFHFPLYSTMNREYSKGTTLYLQAGARPQSTFAGHYDLAAYLVIVLPIIFSVALSLFKLPPLLQLKKELPKLLKQKQTLYAVVLHIIHVLGAWMLVTSGSKTALFAYIVGILIVLSHYIKKLGNFKQQLKWGSVGLITLTVGLLIFLNVFAKDTRSSLISLLRTNSLTNSVISKIVPQTETEANSNKPEDLVGNVHDFKLITIENEDGTKETKWVPHEADWSANALKYGLSMGIRLDTLWPNAIRGFLNMPLFGNGYATLTAIGSSGEFTFAESTDNNLLRTIGETGLLGFLTFYGLILVITLEIARKLKKQAPLIQAISIGYLGSVIGLLINATYIDVFAASKVAYTFWAISGVVLAINKTNSTKTIKNILKHLLKYRTLYASIFLAFLLLHRNPFHPTSQIKGLEISDSQIETLKTTECFIQTGNFTICRNSGLVLNQNANIYSLLLAPFMKLYNDPGMFYVLNLSLFILILFITQKVLPKFIKLIQKQKPREILVFGTSILIVLIGALAKFNQHPLSSLELLFFFIVIPAVLFIYTVLLHKLKFRMSYLVQICMVLAAALLLINQDIEKDLTLHYRNNIPSQKHTTVELANTHFDTAKYLNREHNFYLISEINPYYFDFYGNGNYSDLPISLNSKYTQQAPNVYQDLSEVPNDLQKTYESFVNNDDTVFITNYNATNNADTLENFTKTKQYFDLEYIAVGCDDACNLYQLHPEQPKVSIIPKSSNSVPFSLSNLGASYSFSVVPNTYEPLKLTSKLGYTSYTFANFLNQNITSNFVIVSGDIHSDSKPNYVAAFEYGYTKTPVLYNKGNTIQKFNRPQPSKNQYFYTDSEFFIMLDVSPESTISSGQQLFFYNALLELEKLPNIKNIFIIAHDLNWEDRTQQSNFIFDLEKKLAEFPELTKYVITDSHAQIINRELEYTQEEIIELMKTQTLIQVTDETKKTHYLTASVKNWPNDSFLEFTVLPDKTVKIEFRQNSL